MAVGVGVNVAQLPDPKHTARATKSQLVGQLPLAGANEHTGPSHWQQLTGVAVGVGVNVAQLPDPKHTACSTGSHSVGQLPLAGFNEHDGPSHWQQVTGVAVGVGVKVAQRPDVAAKHTARSTKSQLVGQLPSAGARLQLSDTGPSH